MKFVSIFRYSVLIWDKQYFLYRSYLIIRQDLNKFLSVNIYKAVKILAFTTSL